MIEVYLTVSVGPIPFATMVNREWGHTGQNYLTKRQLPIPEVSVNTRKGVVVNYAPCELAV